MASFDTPIQELVAACSRPESPDAWDELIRRFGNFIRGVVYEVTEVLGVARGHDLRQELVQEVYCRLLENRRRYLRRFRGTTESEALAFFARVARSVVYDHNRRRRAKKRTGRRTGIPLPGTLFFSPRFLEEPTPEDRLLWVEDWRGFWRQASSTLNARPSGRRDLSIFHLYVVEGWNSREISERFHPSLEPTSVLSVVHRVRGQLGLQGTSQRIAA